MRGRSRIRFKLILILMTTCLSVGFMAAYKITTSSKETSTPWVVPDINNPSTKFITRETLVNELQHKQELIPLELDLTEKVTIDDSWGNIELFKKLQNVYLVAKGIYSLDLSKISSDNLLLNDSKKSLTLYAPKPVIKAITIDEQKTIYETPQNGPLRFGEIKLTPAEHQSLLSKAKASMGEKMLSSALYDQALKGSEWALKNLIRSILGDENNYSVTIEFK